MRQIIGAHSRVEAWVRAARHRARLTVPDRVQVAKTLTSASANPFFQGTAQSNFSPVLALDVFLVQAATNTLFSHFLSLCICFLLLRSVDQ